MPEISALSSERRASGVKVEATAAPAPVVQSLYARKTPAPDPLKFTGLNSRRIVRAPI
jgi:hypothetical protein